jgi:hypothetical protein
MMIALFLFHSDSADRIILPGGDEMDFLGEFRRQWRPHREALRKQTRLLACSAVLVACGAAPQVRATTDYRDGALEGRRVVLVPLAVSDDLDDERTGIMLSERTRGVASARACKRIEEAWSDGTLVCLDGQGTKGPSALAELELLFALDRPVPVDVLQNVRKASKADHALLFRPESVSSSRETSSKLKGSAGGLVGSGAVLATSAVVSAIIATSTIREVTVSDTELGYTLSASLVDLRTGKVLKVGVHSGSDSRKTERNLGFAEPPPAAPILEDIMVDLGEDVLDD